MQCIGNREKAIFLFPMHCIEKRESEDMAVTPKSYRGYDSEGKCVSSATAKSATEFIDPKAVADAVEKVKTVATDEMESIATALGKLTDDANDAVIVQGTKMTATFEDVISGIKTIPGQIGDSIEDLKTLAQQAHDEIQTQLNDAAKNSCWCNGAVSVS